MNGKLFTDTYFVRDGNKQAFLIIGKLLESRRYNGRENERNIFMPNARNKIINTTGGIPAIVTHIRYMNAITKADTNETRVFCLLNQILTEDAIRELFPEVWLQWHNKMARRACRHEQQQLRQKPVRDRVHAEVAHLTHNGNARKFLRDGGMC